MSIIVFLIVLAILVLVHEFGHFIVAKKSGIKVEEFGIGFPPRIWGKKFGETIYSINWIPFGGFVRIFGEDNEEVENPEEMNRSFVGKGPLTKIAVLIAGVVFNILLAWLLISSAYMFGVPVATTGVPEDELSNMSLVVTQVIPDSPAGRAGLLPGDSILEIESAGQSFPDPSPEEVISFVRESGLSSFSLSVKRGDSEPENITISPEAGIFGEEPALGIGLESIGIRTLPFHKALWVGLGSTSEITVATVKGYTGIIRDLFTGRAGDILDVAVGPVGIAGLVGDALDLGFVRVVTLTAVISISLAIINLVPFPALDGGRILFVIIESIRKKPISAKVAGTVNLIGFSLLIIALIIITYNDITNIF